MCTNLTIKAKDGSVIVARTMDFASETGALTSIWPQGRIITLEHKVNIEFKAKYTHKDGMNFVSDGYNVKGLSVGSLWLPSTKFEAGSALMNKSIDGLYLLPILLGNCATTDEAIAFLKAHKVLLPSKLIEGFATVHLNIVDASGNNKVVEFGTGENDKGSELYVYDNPVGVMTNAPEFPWHLTNLRNFVQVGKYNVEGKKLMGKEYKRTGFGANQLGIAGDGTPPSRFVRTVYALDAALQFEQPADAAAAMRLADKLMGHVNVIQGTSTDHGTAAQLEKDQNDYTQWTWIKNLSKYGEDVLKTSGGLNYSTPEMTPLKDEG